MRRMTVAFLPVAASVSAGCNAELFPGATVQHAVPETNRAGLVAPPDLEVVDLLQLLEQPEGGS